METLIGSFWLGVGAAASPCLLLLILGRNHSRGCATADLQG